jgi:hypothetical protein
MSKWLNRQLTEFASDEALEAIGAQLHLDDDSFQEVFVDGALCRWIEEHYLDPLEDIETIPPALLARYRQSLAGALRQTRSALGTKQNPRPPGRGF